MNRQIVRAIILLSSVILILAIGWHLYRQNHQFECPTQTRTALLELPPYPNAQNMTIVSRTAGATQIQDSTFQTKDNPHSIIAFYTNHLRQAHWQLTQSDNERVFIFSQTEALPLYGLMLKVAPTTSTSSTVAISLSYGPCIRA